MIFRRSSHSIGAPKLDGFFLGGWLVLVLFAVASLPLALIADCPAGEPPAEPASREDTATPSEERSDAVKKGSGSARVEAKGDSESASADDSASQAGWKPMRKHWRPCELGGDGEVKILGDQIGLGNGSPMTGVRWAGDFPRENFEIRLRARRVKGNDFFAAITFPVGKQHCSLVLGGWGGSIVGISSIDGEDASNNETTQYLDFENERWYAVRIRVTADHLKCWIDEALWVEYGRDLHQFGVRLEMDPTLPVGIANYECESELQGIEMRSTGIKKAAPQRRVASDPASTGARNASEFDSDSGDAGAGEAAAVTAEAK